MGSKHLKDFKFSIFGETLPLPLIETTRTKELILVESTILFAKNGYEAVSVRDIAAKIGIKASSLYNHFSGKEALFNAVLKHAEDLYLLYFKHLDDAIAVATSFEEVLDIIFLEPRRMSNLFTCYAFALIQTEQFRDTRAALIYKNTFLDYSINFFRNWLDICITRGMAEPFDTKLIATLIMQNSLMAITLKVHETLERPIPLSFSEIFDRLKISILKLAKRDTSTNMSKFNDVDQNDNNNTNKQTSGSELSDSIIPQETTPPKDNI